MLHLYDKLEAAALSFIKNNEFMKALDVLTLEYELKPNGFCAKWLGQIELTKGNTLTAINFLEESLSYNSEDEQVMYNLSGAYALLKNYKKSYEVITKLLTKNPNHAGANKVINQLRPLI
jgi:tetratricopeptide (TPR) repeat protein